MNNAEYQFAIFYNNFISELLQKPHTKEMHELLLSKKARSDKELLALYQANSRRANCLNDIKKLRECPSPLDKNLNEMVEFDRCPTALDLETVDFSTF